MEKNNKPDSGRGMILLWCGMEWNSAASLSSWTTEQGTCICMGSARNKVGFSCANFCSPVAVRTNYNIFIFRTNENKNMCVVFIDSSTLMIPGVVLERGRLVMPYLHHPRCFSSLFAGWKSPVNEWSHVGSQFLWFVSVEHTKCPRGWSGSESGRFAVVARTVHACIELVRISSFLRDLLAKSVINSRNDL